MAIQAALHLSLKRIDETADVLEVHMNTMKIPSCIIGVLLCISAFGLFIGDNWIIGWVFGALFLVLGISLLIDVAFGRWKLHFERSTGMLVVISGIKRRQTRPLADLTALVIASVPRKSKQRPYRYELLAEWTDGSNSSLTLDNAAPTSYDHDSYEQIAQRIAAFLDDTIAIKRIETEGWPANRVGPTTSTST
jgi:hypothetical protein